MAPVPKKKKAKQASRTRRASKRMELPMLVRCPNCKKLKIPHVACPHCGFYK